MNSQNTSQSTDRISKKLSLKFIQLSLYLFGDLIRSELPDEKIEEFRTLLRQADIRFQAISYLSVAAMASLTTILFGSIITILVFKGIVHVLISLVFGLVILGGFLVPPVIMKKSRKNDIEDNLHYALNHMAISASSGMPPLEMFKSIMVREEYGEIAKESRKIVRRTETMGDSIDEAIEKTVKYSPSDRFSEIMSGINYTVKGGGDLRQFLENKSVESLDNFESEWDQAIDRLGMFSEIYTIVAIVFPIVGIIMLSVLATVGGVTIDAGMLIKILVFGFLPFLNISFLLMLDIIIPNMK
ncbi:MAG: type II secretion system F family protein [Candidatus Nanosalina sp.]